MIHGRFLLCLHSHMPYVLSHGKSPHGTDWINESAAECYLPLLFALDRLLQEGIKPRWTVNMTPILSEQLEDESFKAGFEEYCQEKIDYAKKDTEGFLAKGEMNMVGLARFWQHQFQRALDQFRDRWDRSIVGGFRFFQEEGSIEIITCGATHGYQPLLATEESCHAQIQVAVANHEKHYGRKPRGIWLPECAYRPSYDWKPPVEASAPFPRLGTEQIVQQHGIEYFFVDSHMIRGGQPLGTYAQKFPQLAELFARSSKFFTPSEEFRSEYEHYVLENGVTVFARDPETTVKVWSGDVGYPGSEYYLEFHKQLYPGRHRYWRISQNKADLGAKQPYDPYHAYEKIVEHAKDFVQTLKSTLAHYKGVADRVGTVVAMYDTELFGHWWWEGPEFLYEVAREMAKDGTVEMVTGSDMLDQHPAHHMIHMPEGSWGEGGYHYIWLNDDNAWTWQKLYPAERRMRELADRNLTGQAREILTQAARELLLAEASDWQFLISTWAARDYAEIRFDDHVQRFFRLADLAESVAEGGVLTEAEVEFLEDCKLKDAPFAELQPDVWRTRQAFQVG